MTIKINWLHWFGERLKEFFIEHADKPQYEIVEIVECRQTGFIKAIIKLSGRHIIEKNISDIVTDNDFIEGLDKKTIRTLTYMATMERMKPDFQVVVQHMGMEVDDYMLELKQRRSGILLKKTVGELVQDKSLIAKLSPGDANRIGYLAGVRETVREYALKNKMTGG